jgi:glucokinase
MRVGIDIGGTKIAAALVAPDGTVTSRAELPTPSAPGAILDAAACLAAPFLRCTPTGAVGVGTAGTVNPRDGSIRYATDSIAGWTGIGVAQELAARLDRAVVVDNDVNAAALGESWAGAARGYDDVLLVAAGTGLGGGLVLGGRIHHGNRGAAGEIAHLPTPGAQHLPCGCGRTGHLESLASGTGLANAYRHATGKAASGRQVATYAAQGDPVAHRVLSEAGTALGRALAGLTALLDPAVVVIGGGAGPALVDSAEAAFRDELLPAWAHVRLAPAVLEADAVVVGAARLAYLEKSCDELV